MCIIRQPVKFFTKNDNSVNFSQIFPQIFSQIVTFSVKKFLSILCLWKTDEEKKGEAR